MDDKISIYSVRDLGYRIRRDYRREGSQDETMKIPKE